MQRTITVRLAPDGTPYAEVVDWDSSDILGYAKVWRPDNRSIKIELPKRLIGETIDHYGWSASTTFHEDGHPDCDEDIDQTVIIACVDHAPDQGEIRHKL